MTCAVEADWSCSSAETKVDLQLRFGRCEHPAAAKGNLEGKAAKAEGLYC